MNKFGTVCTLLIIFLFTSGAVHAQTQARVTSIVTTRNQENTTVRLHVQCKGNTYYSLNSTQLQVTDNGLPVQTFSMLPPSSSTRKAFSAMLVADVSGSMLGSGLAGLQSAAKSLVNDMDTTRDSIGIISFNQQATLIQDCTPDVALLNRAIDSLCPSGATAIWDAAYLGIMVMYSHGNEAQAEILMSDGGDNSSSVTPSFVIQKAQQNGLRIFTIGLGTASMGNELENVANNTGGMYFFSPSASDLSTIFLQIASLTRRDFDEYTLTYKSPDKGATQHEVTIGALVCDSLVTASATRLSKAGVTDAEQIASAGAGMLEILPTSPNPSASGRINGAFTLAQDPGASSPVTITLYDALGRRVAQHEELRATAGMNRFTINTRNLPAGLYQLQVLHAGESRMTKVLITK
jgi:Mg-chelatase subunit ChlD